MPWERAVVDGRFYLPHPTSFTMTPSTGRDFTVTATAGTGAPAMQVEAVATYSSSSSDRRRSLRLLDAASRRVVLTVEDSLARSWVAYWGRSTWRTDRLFTATKKWSTFNTTNVHVFLASNRRERDPDFAVHGSFHGGAMTVSRGYDSAAVIALIDRESIGWGDHKYTLSINPYVDHAFILALTVMLHEMHQ